MCTTSFSSVEKTIDSMDTITLEEMDHVQLMHRRDTKYVIPYQKLNMILDGVKGDYSVLAIQGERLLEYETVYFDTPDYKMYYAHHNRCLDRYKVRMRRYMISDDKYLEVKYKNTCGETLKTRIPIDNFNYNYNNEIAKADFLRANSPFCLSEIKPKLKNKFARITLVSKHRPERLTIDLDLHFVNHDTNKKRKVGDWVIVEVKRDLDNDMSDIVDILSANSYRAEGFSKYCVGTALINVNVKTDPFKQRIRQLGLV